MYTGIASLFADLGKKKLLFALPGDKGLKKSLLLFAAKQLPSFSKDTDFNFVNLEVNSSSQMAKPNHVKVIPLKLFYYQTFLKLGVMNIHDMNSIKMQLKNGVIVLVYMSAGS